MHVHVHAFEVSRQNVKRLANAQSLRYALYYLNGYIQLVGVLSVRVGEPLIFGVLLIRTPIRLR